MKKFLLTLAAIFAFYFSQAQVVCILCYDQNDSISSNVTNLLVNGSFETSTCGGTGYICPSSQWYSCDITGWTCTGGGTDTYAQNLLTGSLSLIVDGSQGVYLGNQYCTPCSNTVDDTSCVIDTGCASLGLPAGFPMNTPNQGGNTGVSISQTATGLTIGATYVLEFWAGGEGSSWPDRGVFGLDVGFGDTILRNKQTPAFSAAIGTRFIVEFMATATSHTIKFTNWGHMCSSCTELVLDDVKLYTLAELNPSIPPCLGINPVALFTAPNHVCPGTCVDFTNMSLNCTSYIWSFPGGNPSVSTDVNPTGICYNTPGLYPVSLIASNLTTSDTLTLNNYLTVYPNPPPQGIIQNGDTLFANPGAIAYQWSYYGNIINGATDYYYVATASGNYSVVATDDNDCEVEAVINNVIAGIFRPVQAPSRLKVYPNPVSGQLYLDTRNLKAENVQISVFDLLGEKMQIRLASDSPLSIDVKDLPSGNYWIEATDGLQTFRSRFLKE